MYDLCHPSYYKISQLGCTDGTKVTIAFYVYIELCEVKRLWDVEYKYNSELDIIYIEGKKSKSSVPETYIPWPSLYKISLVQIENIEEVLKIDRFTFVFRGGDSTSVYYRVTAGLVKPLPPADTKQIKQKEDKKYELEQEIKRNTSILYELAKSINHNESEIIESANKDIVNLPNVEEKLTARIDEKKIKETEDQEKIKNTIDQGKTQFVKAQEKIQDAKDQTKIQDTKDQEKRQDTKTEQNIDYIDTDVEMIFETKGQEKSTEIPDVEMLPST